MPRRKSSALARTSTPTVRISVPRAAPMTRARRAGAVVRRAGKRFASSGAMTPVAAALTSAGVGWAEKSGILDALPTVPGIGRKGTLALAAFFWSKYGGGKVARDVCIVASALAGYEFGKLGSVSGDDGEYAAEGY